MRNLNVNEGNFARFLVNDCSSQFAETALRERKPSPRPQSRGDSFCFSQGRKDIVSWYDLETCSKVIEDGTIGQNTHGFLLVFYSNFGSIILPFPRNMHTYIHRMNRVNSRNGSAMMTAP